MNVDDIGRREGGVLRDRFDRLAAPRPTALTVETSRPRRRGALVGIAVALVVVVTAVLFVSLRDPDPASDPGGTWRRIDIPKGLGPIVAVPQGFVSIGQRTNLRDPTTVVPEVWRSADGEHWDVVHGTRFPPGEFLGFTGVAVDRGVFVASTQAKDLWRSTDAKTWRRVALPTSAEVIQLFLTNGRRGFVALGLGLPSVSDSSVWTSTNGRQWSALRETGTATDPIGIIPSARIGSKWLSLGGGSDALPPKVFSSNDRVHWTVIRGANVPERLQLRLVSNRRHTRVLGIQYEHVEIPGDFGGRLWSTRDGKTWSEITSFHQQMPVANPDHIAQSGKWWVLGGNTGTPDGKRRASMWTSPDLRRWYEMPERLRGPKTDGAAVTVLVTKGRVVGLNRGMRGSHSYVWTPPD